MKKFLTLGLLFVSPLSLAQLDTNPPQTPASLSEFTSSSDSNPQPEPSPLATAEYIQLNALNRLAPSVFDAVMTVNMTLATSCHHSVRPKALMDNAKFIEYAQAKRMDDPNSLDELDSLIDSLCAPSRQRQQAILSDIHKEKVKS
jgi:hypothetical protein